MLQISATQLKERLATEPGLRIIDVRTPAEFAEHSIPTAQNIPLNEVQERIAEFKSTEPTYIICRSGGRSQLATLTLTGLGVDNLYNVTGGMQEWNRLKQASWQVNNI